MPQETDYHTMGTSSRGSQAAYDQSSFHWLPAKSSLVSSTQSQAAFRSPHYPSGNAYYNNLNENRELTQSAMHHHPILSPKPSYKILQD